MILNKQPDNSAAIKPKVLTIIGPTASGKTAFSLKTAELIQSKTGKDVEIISADSRQVFKHIPIATAQPSKDELKKFKHHFINSVELEDDFNAGEFGEKGRKLINKIFSQDKIPVVVGGSGLYISSLIYGLFEYEDDISKEKQTEIRKKLYEKLEKSGIEKLISELKKTDPDTLNAMPNVTERRVIRALEVFYLTGIPISAHRANKIEINFEPVPIGLEWERKTLYGRINNRVDEMVKQGLLDEVKSLQKKGYHYNKFNSLNTVGVKEVFDYLDGIITYERMLELIKQNTRRFAKRQMTWFRRDKNIKWIKPDEDIQELIKILL